MSATHRRASTHRSAVFSTAPSHLHVSAAAATHRSAELSSAAHAHCRSSESHGVTAVVLVTSAHAAAHTSSHAATHASSAHVTTASARRSFIVNIAHVVTMVLLLGGVESSVLIEVPVVSFSLLVEVLALGRSSHLLLSAASVVRARALIVVVVVLLFLVVVTSGFTVLHVGSATTAPSWRVVTVLGWVVAPEFVHLLVNPMFVEVVLILKSLRLVVIVSVVARGLDVEVVVGSHWALRTTRTALHGASTTTSTERSAHASSVSIRLDNGWRCFVEA